VSARIIDGKAVAASLRTGLKARVEALIEQHGSPPGLAVILVGEDPASAVYVRNKIRACEAVGIRSFSHRLPVDVSTDDLVALIAQLNADEGVNGILVQLPLPKHIDIRRVLGTIDVDKDADGFHLYNVGGLVVGGAAFPPATPYGVMKLLESEAIPIEGQNVVVVGASNICHAKTRDLAQYTIIADILIVAAGRPNLIVPQMVKTGAVVIDVGINRLPDGRITGDVDFEGVRQKASYITPVPGGVGPMTVTMLLENTIASAERARGR
jgi:methylenetetrahydrofolate dehydrogenase (NADP+)/methenyltetrahydrofolate cyclohydrolase